MNKDKQIKDLKERNDKLKNQYQLQETKLYSLEYKYNKQKEVLNRLKVVYTSMQFSAPENMYVFIEQMGDLLEEIE